MHFKLVARHILTLLVIVGLGQILGKSFDAATVSTTTAVVVRLKSSRPLPENLIPCIFDSHGGQIGGLGGEILRVTTGEDSSIWHNSLLAMSFVSDKTFTADLPSSSTQLGIMIDHPGFLRGFSAKLQLPADRGTTIIVTLPIPGSFVATADIQYLNQATFEERSKSYCISSSIRQADRYGFEVNKTTPLHDWKLRYHDLAPGIYEIFSTGRFCVKKGEFNGGPAGVAGKSNFTIKPGTLTEMSYPLFPRGKFSQMDKTPPKINYKRLNSSKDSTGIVSQ